MENNSVRISIIMPCYQQVVFVEEAVRSVLDQKVAGVELLVFDPGSQDGSREKLITLQEEYGESLRLFFETDRGQSDAVNKGMAQARGELLGWLNSDDRLRTGSLAKIAATLTNESPRWLYGRAGMIDGVGKPISSWISHYKDWRGRHFSRLKLLTENFIPQMAVFWNRKMWKVAGGLDLNRHLDMDYDLWLRFAQVTNPVVLTDLLADFRVHASAKGSLQTNAQLAAAFETACRHGKNLGWQGAVVLLTHWLLSQRTRIFYRWLKP